MKRRHRQPAMHGSFWSARSERRAAVHRCACEGAASLTHRSPRLRSMASHAGRAHKPGGRRGAPVGRRVQLGQGLPAGQHARRLGACSKGLGFRVRIPRRTSQQASTRDASVPAASRIPRSSGGATRPEKETKACAVQVPGSGSTSAFAHRSVPHPREARRTQTLAFLVPLCTSVPAPPAGCAPRPPATRAPAPNPRKHSRFWFRSHIAFMACT